MNKIDIIQKQVIKKKAWLYEKLLKQQTYQLILSKTGSKEFSGCIYFDTFLKKSSLVIVPSIRKCLNYSKEHLI